MEKVSFMESAYREIKQGILQGKYRKNEIYSAQFFAKEMQISRTPVREALLQLKDEGLVDIIQNRGVKIKELSKEKLYEISQIRSAIDGYCAAYFADNVHSKRGVETLSLLKEICQKEEKLLNEESLGKASEEINKRWYALDAEFHSVIIKFSGNLAMNNLIENYETYLSYVGLATAEVKNRKAESVEENYRIVKAIETGDTAQAFVEAKNHVEQIHLRMLLCLSD